MKKPKKVPNPPRVCIFCGGRPISKEHIWSRWTYQYIPRLKGSHTRGFEVLHPQGGPRFGYDKRYTGQANTIKVEAVCKACNSGWMSEVENQAKPHLIPLFLGLSDVLSPEALRSVATWLVMKCMVIEWEHPVDVVSTQADRDFLKTNRQPPASWRLWIGLHQSEHWRTGWLRSTAGLLVFKNAEEMAAATDYDRARNTQTITIGFRRLFVHAYHTRTEQALPRLVFPTTRYVRQIWPVTGSLLWPFSVDAPRGLIDGLSVALARLTTSLPMKRG